MSTEYEPIPQENTEVPDSQEDDRDFSDSPFYPLERPDLNSQPPTVRGKLPGGSPTSESMPSTAGQEDVDDELDQPTAGEFVTEVPGFEGNGATEPSIHDSNPDQVAIALARKLQAAAEYARVAGQMALPSVQTDSDNTEQ